VDARFYEEQSEIIFTADYFYRARDACAMRADTKSRRLVELRFAKQFAVRAT